ncbi:hypothetical protein GCM10027395_05850 [Giesbergeria sinuosa]
MATPSKKQGDAEWDKFIEWGLPYDLLYPRWGYRSHSQKQPGWQQGKGGFLSQCAHFILSASD